MEDNKVYEELILVEDNTEEVEANKDYEYEADNSLGKFVAIGAAGLVAGAAIVKLVPKAVGKVKEAIKNRKQKIEEPPVEVMTIEEEETED